ncbi:MAG TPA: phosphoglycerate kinase [Myxococcota bacterium]|nr:phosphoglycerate kinase [Myxococcota bacterium]
MSSAASLPSVADLRLAGRRVFIRADLNVPLRDGAVADDSRIRASLETLDFVRRAGGRAVLASHLGRPKAAPDPKYSLAPVARHMGLALAPDCVGPETEARVAALRDGEAILLENLRFHPGEEANDPAFVARLAQLCDAYVNDAFGTAHRAHASTEGLAHVCSDVAAGFLLQREVAALTRVRDAPEHPYVCVLGGAKVSDKLAVLESLAARADTVAIGGAMAYTFLLAKGEPVGKSLVEPELVATAKRLLAGETELLLPVDHVVAASPDDTAGARTVERIPDGAMALDVGPRSRAALAERVARAKTVFWNGPLGLFEKPPFDAGTRAVAQMLAASSAYTVVGGGDSLAAVQAAGVAARIRHLSTGGGASLEFLEGRALPGVEALRRRG